jgi:hypothetical protein
VAIYTVEVECKQLMQPNTNCTCWACSRCLDILNIFTITGEQSWLEETAKLPFNFCQITLAQQN